MSSLLLLLRQFAAFAFYLINRVIFVTTKPILAILLLIINLCFDIVGLYDVDFAIIIIILIIVIIYFFLALGDGFPMECEWQDSSQYSVRSL